MEDMLSRIVNMDEKVRLETQQAQQNKADTFKIISEKREAIYNEYISNAREEIEKTYQLETKVAEERLKTVQNKQQECLAVMEKMYRQNAEKWVDEIVERVIHS